MRMQAAHNEVQRLAAANTFEMRIDRITEHLEACYFAIEVQIDQQRISEVDLPSLPTNRAV